MSAKPASATTIRSILIVDDLPDARQWLRQAASEAFPEACFSEAGDLAGGFALLAKGAKEKFDLLLADLELPDGSGIRLIREAKRLMPELVVVVATIHDGDEFLFPALRAGAQGYILKEHPREEIATMLQKAVAGTPPVSPTVARKLIGFFQESSSPDANQMLTQRESAVLSLVAKGYTISETAANLQISPHTASDHLKSCYRKLHISNRAEAASEAIRLGLIR